MITIVDSGISSYKEENDLFLYIDKRNALEFVREILRLYEEPGSSYECKNHDGKTITMQVNHRGGN